MDTPRRSATPDATLMAAPDVDPAVAAFLSEVRAEYRAPLPNDVVSDHLRMILAEAAIAPKPALRDRWARRGRRIAAIGAVKIALTATAAAAATGTGFAATGNLPAPAQAIAAEVASLVGITLPTPATDAPDARTDDARNDDARNDDADGPGIGEGGVPALIEDGSEDLPGNTGSAPGLHKEDGRPVTPAEDRPTDARDGHADSGSADTGSDRAETRPQPARPDAADEPDDTPTPAADRPAPPAERRGTTQDTTTQDTADAEPAAPAAPAERPDQADEGRGSPSG